MRLIIQLKYAHPNQHARITKELNSTIKHLEKTKAVFIEKSADINIDRHIIDTLLMEFARDVIKTETSLSAFIDGANQELENFRIDGKITDRNLTKLLVKEKIFLNDFNVLLKDLETFSENNILAIDEIELK